MANFTTFSLNYDYRCPFARNLNEHVVAAIKGGAQINVDFVPFNLSQVHVDEDAPPIWDDPDREGDLLANEIGYIVSKIFPDRFHDTHISLFRLRHDAGKTLRQFDEIARVLEVNGVDSEVVRNLILSKTYAKEVRALHEYQVKEFDIFGVPTVFDGDNAAFIRLMSRPTSDLADSVNLINHAVEHVFKYSVFNEIKHSRVSR